MTSPRQVGQAFVEILGDFARFGKDAEKKLNGELRELGRQADFQDLIDAAADAGEEAGAEFVDEFGDELVRGGKKAARLSGNALREGIDDALDGVRNTAENAFDFIQNAASGIGKGLTGVLTQLGRLGPLLIVKLLAAGPAIAATVLGLSGIASQLSHLVGLLGIAPGAVATLVAAVVPLVIAFQGFGDALEAITEGDPEKIAEAMKNLSPAARGVAREFQVLLPLFRTIRQLVQQAFFQEISGALTRLTKALSPALVGGLTLVATALGRFFDALSRKLATPAVATQIARIFEATANVVGALGTGGLRLMEGLLAVLVASLPTVEALATAFGDLLATIGDKLIEAVESGEFQKWIDDALEVGGKLLEIFKHLWEFVTILFALTDEEGKAFLDNINTALAEVNKFLKDPTTIEALKGLLQLFKFIVQQVLLLGLAFAAVAMFVGFVIQKVRDLLHWMDRLAVKLGILDNTRAFIRSRIPALAEGTVVRRPTLAVIGEAGPEAVVPLNNPSRRNAVMREAGLLNLGFGGSTTPTVQVFLGTQEITDILDVRVVRALDEQGRALTRGPRAA